MDLTCAVLSDKTVLSRYDQPHDTYRSLPPKFVEHFRLNDGPQLPLFRSSVLTS